MHGHCPICRNILYHMQIFDNAEVKGHMIDRYIIKSPVYTIIIMISRKAEISFKVAIASKFEMTSRLANCTLKKSCWVRSRLCANPMLS